MGSKADKRYANSPKLARDDGDGKMKVTKPEKKTATDASGTEGSDRGAADGMKEMMDKHAMERLQLHQKHETEYMGVAQKLMNAAGEAGGDKLIDKTNVGGDE